MQQTTEKDIVLETENNEFAADVINGLSQIPKRLSSKYFYDAKGDELFQQIMKLDEYYLTRTEFEIFKSQKEQILQKIKESGAFDLYELGAGDGYKTKILLKHFLEEGIDFEYAPIDISGNVLEQLTDSLKDELPDLKVRPLEGDYFKMLSGIEGENFPHKVVMFLGSNIGNFTSETAYKFLKELRNSLNPEDFFFIGVDLKKDPNKILRAYDDSKGITKAFNLNLLERINNTFDGDFNVEQFQHYPYYDPATGECRSYLISKVDQRVTLDAIGKSFQFKAWEAIHMEISKKYDLEELEKLAAAAGFDVIHHFTDKDNYFVDSLWKAV